MATGDLQYYQMQPCPQQHSLSFSYSISTALDKHLEPVYSVLMRGVAHKWMAIGLLLGIPYSQLKMLEYSDGPDEMVRGVLCAWLEERHNTQVFGRPSWRKLVEVVGARAGGNHAALAQEIAREHSTTVANG